MMAFFYRIEQMKEVYKEIYQKFAARHHQGWTDEPFRIQDGEMR